MSSLKLFFVFFRQLLCADHEALAEESAAGPILCKGRQGWSDASGQKAMRKELRAGVKPKNDLNARPDTWSSWPRLLPALLPADGVSSTIVEQHVSSGRRIPQSMADCVVRPRGSARVRARAQEDAEWQKFVQELLHRLHGSLSVALLFCDLGELAEESFLHILKGKAPATLRRHLLGWKLWSTFALEQGWSLYDPEARTRWLSSSGSWRSPSGNPRRPSRRRSLWRPSWVGHRGSERWRIQLFWRGVATSARERAKRHRRCHCMLWPPLSKPCCHLGWRMQRTCGC